MKATDEDLIELGLRIASGEMVLEQVEEWVLRHIS